MVSALPFNRTCNQPALSSPPSSAVTEFQEG
jgi:hypothetical protein